VILALETATPVGGVALVESGSVLAERTLDMQRQAARDLMPAVDAMLEELGRPLGEVEHVALSIGPGSFTGLRIGLASALGLCFGTQRRIVPVPTLAALALSAQAPSSGASSSEADIFVRRVSESDVSKSDVSESDASESDVSESNVSESDVSESNVSESNVSVSDGFASSVSEAHSSRSRVRVVPMLDARKGQVYAGVYAPDGSVRVPDRAMYPLDFLHSLDAEGPYTFLGSGAHLYRNEVRSVLGQRARLLDLDVIGWPRASWVGLFAERQLKSEAPLEPEQVELRYLRASQAETERAG